MRYGYYGRIIYNGKNWRVYIPVMEVQNLVAKYGDSLAGLPVRVQIQDVGEPFGSIIRAHGSRLYFTISPLIMEALKDQQGDVVGRTLRFTLKAEGD